MLLLIVGARPMNRIYLVGVIFSGLAACASTDPEPVATVATAPTAVVSQSIPTANEPVAEGSELHVVDVPEVAQVAQVAHHSPQEDIPNPDELICRRIKITGSHRVTRVCMTRAEIEQRRAESRAMADGVRKAPDGRNLDRRIERPSRTD